MVDFLNSAHKDSSDGHLRHIMGKTQGILKSRLLSVIEGSNDLITGLSSRLESALSLSTESVSEESTTPVSNVEVNNRIPNNSASTELFTRKLRFPQFGSGLSFEDYTTIARHRQEKAHAKENSVANGENGHKADDESHPSENQSQASSDSNNSCRYNQSIELRATGPDPYEKLKYKTGEYTYIFS